jgi:hypothetical protein
VPVSWVLKLGVADVWSTVPPNYVWRVRRIFEDMNIFKTSTIITKLSPHHTHIFNALSKEENIQVKTA